MNFSDFIKRLGADPWNRDPETLRARHSSPEFEQAAQDAEAFERKLQDALEVPADPALKDELMRMVDSTPPRRAAPRWLALAATVVLMAGAASIYWLQIRQPEDIRDYVAQHLAHDGASLLSRATGQANLDEVQSVLARFGVGASPQLAERIQVVKLCPTPDGGGVHMALATADGAVHLIYMPETQVTDGAAFQVDGMLTRLLELKQGSAAIVGTDKQIKGLGPLVRDAIQPLQSRT
ncbi:MAG: DUF3379 family protein [Lysobacterales bacterium]|jgi:hypothetical protein